MTSLQYVQSRTRDATSLSRDIQESGGALGYCTVITPTKIVHGVTTHEFDSPAAAREWILKKFW